MGWSFDLLGLTRIRSIKVAHDKSDRQAKIHTCKVTKEFIIRNLISSECVKKDRNTYYYANFHLTVRKYHAKFEINRPVLI